MPTFDEVKKKFKEDVSSKKSGKQLPDQALDTFLIQHKEPTQLASYVRDHFCALLVLEGIAVTMMT